MQSSQTTVTLFICAFVSSFVGLFCRLRGIRRLGRSPHQNSQNDLDDQIREGLS